MKIDINKIKNLLRILILVFLVLYGLSVLVIFLKNTNIIENFENDCSDCNIKPSGNKCNQINDISYYMINNEISFNIIDTSNLFCPWQENCSSSQLFSSNQERYDAKFTCCQDSSFYNQNTVSLHNIYNSKNIIDKCQTIRNSVLELSLNNLMKYNKIINSNEYLNLISVCNYQDISDISGLYFLKQTQQEDDNSLNLTLLDKDGNFKQPNVQYLLNKNEFLDCFGEKQDYSNMTFNASELTDFSVNNYFGVNDPNITTITDNTDRLYPEKQDLEMELKNLENIPPGGNVPVSVINQYLTAINGFYENQIEKTLGPRTHTFNQELEFDNYTTNVGIPEIKSPQFITYDSESNNQYTCISGITGNSNFDYCGPQAYKI
jgi:hypothetical protein